MLFLFAQLAVLPSLWLLVCDTLLLLFLLFISLARARARAYVYK